MCESAQALTGAGAVIRREHTAGHTDHLPGVSPCQRPIQCFRWAAGSVSRTMSPFYGVRMTRSNWNRTGPPPHIHNSPRIYFRDISFDGPREKPKPAPLLKRSIVSHLEERGIRYLDDRDRPNGCLWIAHHKKAAQDLVAGLISEGVEFHYRPVGKSWAKGKPIWWTRDPR
jgi:hypothetical protein